MVKSSEEEKWSQNKKWPRMDLSIDSLTLSKVNGKIPTSSPDLTVKYLSVSS